MAVSGKRLSKVMTAPLVLVVSTEYTDERTGETFMRAQCGAALRQMYPNPTRTPVIWAKHGTRPSYKVLRDISEDVGAIHQSVKKMSFNYVLLIICARMKNQYMAVEGGARIAIRDLVRIIREHKRWKLPVLVLCEAFNKREVVTSIATESPPIECGLDYSYIGLRYIAAYPTKDIEVENEFPFKSPLVMLGWQRTIQHAQIATVTEIADRFVDNVRDDWDDVEIGYPKVKCRGFASINMQCERMLFTNME